MGWFNDTFGVAPKAGFTNEYNREEVDPKYIPFLKRVGVYGGDWSPEHLNSMGKTYYENEAPRVNNVWAGFNTVPNINDDLAVSEISDPYPREDFSLIGIRDGVMQDGSFNWQDWQGGQ